MDRILSREEIAKLFSSEEYFTKARRFVEGMVKQHKNIPSVIMYSVNKQTAKRYTRGSRIYKKNGSSL